MGALQYFSGQTDAGVTGRGVRWSNLTGTGHNNCNNWGQTTINRIFHTSATTLIVCLVVTLPSRPYLVSLYQLRFCV